MQLAKEKEELVAVHSKALKEEQVANIQYRAVIDKQGKELIVK